MPEHSSHITKKMLTMSTEMPADGFTLVLLLKVYLKKNHPHIFFKFFLKCSVEFSSIFYQLETTFFVKSISRKFREIDFTKIS